MANNLLAEDGVPAENRRLAPEVAAVPAIPVTPAVPASGNARAIRDDGVRYDAARLAAMSWSFVAEGGDERAYQAVHRYGYADALARLRGGDLELQEIAGSAWEAWRKRAERLTSDDSPTAWLRSLARLEASVIIPGDPLWPALLNDLGPRAPLALWVRGKTDSLRDVLGEQARPSISIVGSRAASQSGLRIATDFAYELAARFTITSGGAFGIDAAVHKGALLAGGPTVIFSAAGVDRDYPAAHRALFKEVRAGSGLVISEHPLGAAPQAHRFLLRNRLIAAFSRATVVVQAPVRSGALSTARAALAIGRPVGAVPGSVSTQQSAGCHELIRNGGTLVASVNHILELVSPIGAQLELAIAGGGQQSAPQNAQSGAKSGGQLGAPPGAHSANKESMALAPDFFSPPPSPEGEIGARCLDAVPWRQPAAVETIAFEAGLSVAQTRAELGKLALLGRVVQREGRWVKSGKRNPQRR